MDIIWPGLLLLLGLIPALVAVYMWILRRRKRFTVRYSSLSLIRMAQPGRNQVRQHIPFVLFLLSTASLVLAISRPVAVVTVPASERTVILAIDVSRSMCSTDIQPNRLEAAKTAALSFIERQKGNLRIGIIAFAGFAAVIQPPTDDQELLLDAVERISTARRTAIGSGILKAIDALAEMDPSIPPSVFGAPEADPDPRIKGTYTPAIIVVLTDGVSNVGLEPLDAAKQALERGLRVYTIGYGTANNTSVMDCDPFTDGDENFRFDGNGFGGGFGGGFRRGIDEETLQEIADMTGGEYYAAESANDLLNVFQNLPTDMIVRREAMEIGVFFAALGAILVGAALVLSQLWNPLL